MSEVGEIEKFGKQVFGKVLQQIEEKELAEIKGRVSCREKVPRYLFTRLGLIRFERHKVKYKDRGLRKKGRSSGKRRRQDKRQSLAEPRKSAMTEKRGRLWCWRWREQ